MPADIPQIMVCDTQLLIKDLDIFQYLVKEKWDVVVPNDGIYPSLRTVGTLADWA
jgi:hypothetical protein